MSSRLRRQRLKARQIRAARADTTAAGSLGTARTGDAGIKMHIKVPLLDLSSHHAPLREEFDRAIREVIDSNAFAGGPFVEKFEADFAAYNNCAYAIGLGSGTEALWLALLACGVGEGDEVITVPTTFMATAEAITYCRA